MITRDIEWIVNKLDATYIGSNIKDSINGVNIDSRLITNNNLFIPIIGERVDGHDCVEDAFSKGALVSLWNKNNLNYPKDRNIIIVEDTKTSLAILAKEYAKELKAKFIGITGSNGKTSTKDMLHTVLSEKYKVGKTQGNFNNDIGLPLTLLSFDEDIEYGVVEMGMDKLKEIEYYISLVDLDCAIITSIGDAHLLDLGSIENVAKAKCEISYNLDNKDLIFIDDILISNELDNISFKGNRLSYGENINNTIYLTSYSANEQGIKFSTNLIENINIAVYGKHQAFNAMGVILVALKYGMSKEEVINGFNKVVCTKMRNEVFTLSNSRILNDSYKSNPQSVLAGLETMTNFNNSKYIVVLADMLELGDNEIQLHEKLGKDLSQFKIDELLTYGDLAYYISNSCDNINIVKHYDNKDDIVTYLLEQINNNVMIFIKGSRGMKLDYIVDELRKRYNND